MEQMPCGQFCANALFFAVGVHGVQRLQAVRGFGPARLLVHQAGRGVRYAFYAVAGKVVNTGGQLLLRINREAHEMFTQVRQAVALVESG